MSTNTTSTTHIRDPKGVEAVLNVGALSVLIGQKYGNWLVYAVVFVSLLFRNESISEHVVGFLFQYASPFCFLLLLVAAVLLVIRRTRYLGSLLMLICGHMFSLTALCISAVVTSQNWGAVGLIGGSILAGYGIIFVAIVSGFFHNFNGLTFVLFYGVLSRLCFGMGNHYFNQEENRSKEVAIDAVGEATLLGNDFKRRYPEAHEIVDDFANFLAESPSKLINDDRMLPHPKQAIDEAFAKYNAYLVNLLEQYKTSAEVHVHADDIAETEHTIELVKNCWFETTAYAAIDPEDFGEVAYFNTYEDLSDIPKSELVRFINLSGKYLSNRFGEEPHEE